MAAPRLRPTLRNLWPSRTLFGLGQSRWLHKTRPSHQVPEPVPFVPDVHTFLTLIGRGMNKYANKFPSWDSLFSLTSPELKQLGIEPPRNRRYLLQWMQRYRKGQLGPGGDFQYVHEGKAMLKVATPPSTVISPAKWVVNVPVTESELAASEAAANGEAETQTETAEGEGALQTQIVMDLSQVQEIFNVKGYTVRGRQSVAGPFAKPLPGNAGAIVKVTEGMWAHERGRKIDGGERRRGEVRFKKRSAARRAQREAETLASMNM